MGPDVDRPEQVRQPGDPGSGGPAQVVDLTAAEPEEGGPATEGRLSVRVGCEVCGARRSYRTAAATRAFFAVHPYACGQPAPASATGDAPTAGR